MENAVPKRWKKLLRGEKPPPDYVKVDWEKWVDEEEEGTAGLHSSESLSIFVYIKLTLCVFVLF